MIAKIWVRSQTARSVIGRSAAWLGMNCIHISMSFPLPLNLSDAFDAICTQIGLMNDQNAVYVARLYSQIRCARKHEFALRRPVPLFTRQQPCSSRSLVEYSASAHGPLMSQRRYWIPSQYSTRSSRNDRTSCGLLFATAHGLGLPPRERGDIKPINSA